MPDKAHQRGKIDRKPPGEGDGEGGTERVFGPVGAETHREQGRNLRAGLQ